MTTAMTTTDRITVGYLRQSMDDPDGCVRQREDITRHCAARGVTIAIWFEDNEESASPDQRNGKARPKYAAMLDLVRTGTVERIAVQVADRLYRSIRDLEDLIDLCNAHNTALWTVSGDLDLSTDAGRLVARILGAVGRGEVERKGARQKRAAKQMAEAGKVWWTTRPFGFDADRDADGRWSPKGREIRLHPVEAPLLADAYRAVLAGAELETISKKWNRQGVTGPKGGTWRGANLGPLLLCARNAGIREYDGAEVAVGNWPPIVNRDLYEGVKAILSDPDRRTRTAFSRKYLLSGIATCGRCEHTLGSGKTAAGSVTYRCKNCFGITRNAGQLDAVVIEAVVDRLSRDDAADLVADRTLPDIDNLIEQRKALREQQKALGVQHGNGEVSLVFATAADRRFTEQIEALSVQIDDAPRAEMFEDVIGADDVDAAFAGVGLDRQRVIISALLTVTVNTAGRGKTFNRRTVDVRFR